MYCTNCGSEIPDEAKFCPYCSIQIDGSTSPPIQTPQPSQPTQTPYQGTPYTPSKPSKTKGGAAIAVLLVVIVSFVLIYFGTQYMYGSPTTGVSLLVIGAVILCCIGSSLCGTGKRRGRSYGGGGCDCSGCDCDCDGCDCS